MRISNFIVPSCAASLLALTVAACSGSGGSTFDAEHPPDLGPVTPTPDLGHDAGLPNSACATATAQAQLVPVYLVFMFDRSGSMSENQKWPTAVAGLEQFFGDPKSTGLYASIAFFANLTNECSVASYATPAVAMTALPATTFRATIDAYTPNAGTPTLPALKGAIQYAQQMQAQHPGEKVAVVLATDGIPNDCSSDVNNVSAEAQSVASTIPTYVIGVGDQLQNLDTIAAGGGTKKALVVSVGNPAQTATDFQNALATIRGNVLSCEYKLPAAPAGKTLDINNVNVQYTPASGPADVLTYNASCGGSGAGWHYDDAANPTKITLCPSTCTTVQADTKAKIDIVLGCATKGGITK